MDTLPDSLLLQILSRLNDSADVARCRVAYKAFNTVFPDLRSINLRCSVKWSKVSRFRVPRSCQHIKPFYTVFLDLISKQRTVESVCLGAESPFSCVSHGFDLTDVYFAEKWVPRVSESLKSLSLCGRQRQRQSNVLYIISKYCHSLVSLRLENAWLIMDSLNPMPTLTSLTLEYTVLDDEDLNELNKCFPNLQLLNLVCVKGLENPKIHLLNLQTCYWAAYNHVPSLTLITPNLITLKIESLSPIPIHVEAPMLSHFHLSNVYHTLTAKKFENLKTLWLFAVYISSLLSVFPITKTVETLTLDSGNEPPRDARDSKITLRKVFMVFPNVSCLRINSGAWSELEACLDPQGWEILDGRKGLKTLCAYVKLVDPLLTISSVSRVLDQCVGLSEVLLHIHASVVDIESKSFMSKCMARWPRLKWRWGIWSDDSWITDAIST